MTSQRHSKAASYQLRTSCHWSLDNEWKKSANYVSTYTWTNECMVIISQSEISWTSSWSLTLKMMWWPNAWEASENERRFLFPVWNAPLVIFCTKNSVTMALHCWKARDFGKLCHAGFGTGTKWSLQRRKVLNTNMHAVFLIFPLEFANTCRWIEQKSEISPSYS